MNERVILEKNRTHVLLQFNNVTKAQVGVLFYVDPRTLNNTDFTYIETMFDTENEVVVGNLDNYEIIPRWELPEIVFEPNVDAEFLQSIQKEFPLLNILQMIANATCMLVDNSINLFPITQRNNVEQLKQLQRLTKLVNNTVVEIRERKQFYRDSDKHYFVSYDEITAEESKGFPGLQPHLLYKKNLKQ